MKKLFVFIGESGSGKTTLVNELVKRYPDKFKKVITCTSRTPRAGEVDGEDYHFISGECFNDNSDLVLVKNPIYGDCYGTKKSDLFSETRNLLMASRPSGISKLIALGFKNVVVVRIEISEILKIERMRQRGDSEQMISERLESDASIFREINFDGVLGVVEIEAKQSLDQKVESIMKAC
jgi:guanylate kinase